MGQTSSNWKKIIWREWRHTEDREYARHLFDLTDEDVERFAIQIGNDTDPFRQPRYKQMRCTIAPGCELSKNTWKILRSFFGDVERGEPSKPATIVQKESGSDEVGRRSESLPLMTSSDPEHESIAQQ